jgi:DNA-binding SARP family transcriptional activator
MSYGAHGFVLAKRTFPLPQAVRRPKRPVHADVVAEPATVTVGDQRPNRLVTSLPADSYAATMSPTSQSVSFPPTLRETAPRVQVLGQISVTTAAGETLPAVDLPRRARQVLAVLAARHGRPQSKESLADAVWAGDPPGNLVAALEHYVSVIRRRLQPDATAAEWFIVTRAGGYLFDTGRVHLDLAQLRNLVRMLDTLSPDCPERLAIQQDILTLGRELPFPEDPYADWAEATRDEVQAAVVAARLELSAAALPADGARALRLAQEAIELNPFLEQAYRTAMTAAMAAGRTDEALRLFERCRRTLDEELGVAPSPELVRMQQQIVDARQPEPSALLLAGSTAVETFVGRATALRVLLDREPPRVVHIVGPDGAGKSAFLTELGRHLDGRIGIGRAGPSQAVHRLAWLRAVLAELGAPPEVLTLVDRATPDQPLTRAELHAISETLTAPVPVFVAVDDAAALDAASVAELAWLGENCPSLRIVLTYCYPSEIAGRPVSGLGTAVVLRLGPLTPQELAPLGDKSLADLTGGIPALVAVARAPREIALAVAMQIARRRTCWMPSTAWDVLRYCAVLDELRAADLVALTGRPVPDVLSCVDHLIHAGLLGESTGGRVGHRSTLIRDAVAEQVSLASRLHLRQSLAAAA